MITGVVSSTGFNNRDTVLSALDKHIKEDSLVLIGEKKRVDHWVNEYCENRSILVEVVPQLKSTGESSYLYQNLEILFRSGLLIVFFDGFSKGTEFIIKYARERGRDIVVYEEHYEKKVEQSLPPPPFFINTESSGSVPGVLMSKPVLLQ